MAAPRRFFGKANDNGASIFSDERWREEVARLAYRLYEERGCEPGHDVEDWLKAEALIRERQPAAAR